MNLNKNILELLSREDCHIVGFADLSCLPEEARMHFKYGIVMALSFTKEAILENKNGLPQRYYKEHAPMTQRLGELKNIVADFLADKGYEAVSDTPASVVNNETLRSALPQKTVATLAGIGWIGKCAMLVTHEAGSALRLTTVLTNAPVNCGKPITKSECGVKCTACVDICPGKAPTGVLWAAEVDRDVFFDAHACRTAARARAKSLLGAEESVCGLCISNCPYTKKGLGYK